MMHTKYLIIPIVICTSFSFAMEDASTPIPDSIPIICKHIDVSSVSKLLRTCKTYHDIYSKGIPKNFIDDYDQLTKEKWNTMQFGIDRFLQQNPNHCHNLDSDQHTHTLVHYAQTNNPTMFEHIMACENAENRKNRVTILAFFNYITADRNVTLLEDVFNVENNMQAYTAIAKTDIGMQKDFFFKSTHACYGDVLIKIFLLNGMNLTTTDINGSTALHHAASNNNHRATRFLLNHTSLVNATERKRKLTPLHIAAYRGNTTIIDLLIQAGATINVTEKRYNTPLHIAILHRNRSCIIKLLQHGADVTLDGRIKIDGTRDYWSALDLATHRGYHKDPEIGPLLEAADPSTGITRTIAAFFRKL